MVKPRDAADETTEPGSGAATIVDVAKAAGVSPSTVSYVITGKRPISPRTRRLVEETIRKVGYQRRPWSSAMVSQRVGVLAMAVPLRGGENTGTEMEFFAAAAAAARARHFDLLLVTHDEGIAGLRRVTSAALADAVIVMEVAADDPRLPILLTAGQPSVLVGVPDRPDGLTCVDLDFRAAGAACVTHLADLGHRSVVHIGPPPETYLGKISYATRFLEGVTTAAARHGMRAASGSCSSSAAEITACLDGLFAEAAPTALVVDNEKALPLVLAAVHRRGLRVPEDLSLVAVSSETVAKQQRLRPTGVVIPARALGELAVERAALQLDGRSTTGVELLAPRVMVGETTARAPR
ncbi:LacI family transcriptional regulator [Amycolatopsis sp. NBC_01488]|uniref:LacI family DNA-binding transcriptional regulator n=1 Tax=Amycolatopsis sp. NBC_01488 TaxID=2903563 RepID=UPI002E2DDA26|nr:LacI family DNA-binding transcriptional regulator [Amycolatopsis sp. NBC_01488]